MAAVTAHRVGSQPAPSRPRTRRPGMPRPDLSWQDSAACRDKDLALFFGREGERTHERDAREKEAKQICSDCPVRTACLDYAQTAPQRYGLWGGLTEDERADLRRRRRRKGKAA